MLEGMQVNDVRAWVFRVARNLWIDNRRELRRYWTTYEDTGDRRDSDFADHTLNPELQVLRQERIQLIGQGVLRLPRLQRDCLRLKAQGLRYYEIAVALNISMTTAVDSVRRAVKTLGRRF